MALISQAAWALAVARMALPPDFEVRALRVELDGFGGRNAGQYRFVDLSGTTYSGEFRRDQTRLGVFDPLVVRSKARGAFTFTDAAADIAISAFCEMRKITLTAGIVTFDPKKLAYQCELRSGPSLMAARLVIGQPKREGLKKKVLAQDLRRGEALLLDHYLAIESVHDYRGSRFGSQAPVGYLLLSQDRVVAAVELTDVNPSLYLSSDLSPDLQRAIHIVALAIAVFRDPAHSALEPD
jgi:hypothetical protein